MESEGATTLTGFGTIYYRNNPYSQNCQVLARLKMDSQGSGFYDNQAMGLLPAAARPGSRILTNAILTDMAGTNENFTASVQISDNGQMTIRNYTPGSSNMYYIHFEVFYTTEVKF